MRPTRRSPGGHTLVVRLDNLGDVLLSGPAVRAVAAGSDRVSYLAGRRGAPAALLLPGVDEVVAFRAPWVEDPPPAFDGAAFERLVSDLARLRADRALVLTSFHQSPLPSALALRMAGIERIAAYSVDYAGGLLDVRLEEPRERHEVDRALELAASLGFSLPFGDDGRLALRPGSHGPGLRGLGPYGLGPRPVVVVHPGASQPARTWRPARFAELAAALVKAGYEVVVTGSGDESTLVAGICASAPGAIPAVVGGRLASEGSIGDPAGGPEDGLRQLAGLIEEASVVVVGNTGPAHLAAALGRPVVSLFAPTVPAGRWHPWMVPHVLLGDQEIACAGCRARRCPFEVQACLESVSLTDVLEAIEGLASRALVGSGMR